MKLDIGCGRDKHGDVGIDIDTRSYADIIASAEYLPFRDNTFDTVFTREALDYPEFLGESLEQAAREVCRVLKPEGTLIFETFDRLPEEFEKYFKVVRKGTYIPKWFMADVEAQQEMPPPDAVFISYVCKRR
ncbi:MAG: class I SAM-dependent methyltransferase [Candidatus Thorarchaeota archaeon]